MVRRAALASFLVLLLSAANVLAATKTVSIYSSYYSPVSVKVAMGGSVKWANTTGKKHSVASDTSFLATWFFPTRTVSPHTTSSPVTFPEAGTFAYHDTLHSALHGTVVVPMTVDATVISLGESVTLTLGTVPASQGGPVWHDVQGRVNGGSWTTIASTSGNMFVWKPTTSGTWEVQTRLHHALSGANTGFSPIVTVTVS